MCWEEPPTVFKAQFLTGHLFDGKKRKIVVKQTHPPLYERASLGGCLLLTIDYDAFFFLLQVCLPASVMQFTQEISRKYNRCHVKDLRLIIVRFSNCRKNFTEFKVG